MQELHFSKFGHGGEAGTIELLKKHGSNILKKEGLEGKIEDDMGIDCWAQLANSRWAPIQLSFNQEEMHGDKGKSCLREKIVPVLLDDDEYDAAQSDIASEKKLVESFWDQVNKTVSLFPEVACRRPAVEAMAIHPTRGRGSQ